MSYQNEWEEYTQQPPTRPVPDDIHHTRGCTMPKLNLEDVKAGLTRLLPVVETVARLTPNKIDDAAVLFLKALLADDSKISALIEVK